MNYVSARNKDWPTIAETRVLRWISTRGWVTCKDIAEHLSRSSSTINELVMRLEAKCFIARRAGSGGYKFGVTSYGALIADLAKTLEIGE